MNHSSVNAGFPPLTTDISIQVYQAQQKGGHMNPSGSWVQGGNLNPDMLYGRLKLKRLLHPSFSNLTGR